jgi:uncharacterized membrane protein YkvA (DUF1232 family)
MLQPKNPQSQVAEDKKEKTRALIITLLGAIYAISPLDIIPDIPIIGWVDDFFVLSAAILNLLEHFTGRTHYTFRSILRALKWTIVILGAIIILLLLLLGAVIINWLT